MTSADKELEDRLMEVGSRLASPPSSAEELLALLDQTENFLSRVDQSPSQSLTAALRPAMKVLVAKNLLEHSDIDVKVAVASCVSEITRITAPDAPYDDDLMKAIFQMIVEAFEKLDDISSRSYSKRVSILETVAKVRSCVVMLDLECDALILEMFHHFLKTIRSNHPENVFSSMEMIMTLVLEESEDISSELLSCLLDSVKKDKDVLPTACRLGEKVIGNCAVKLKPYLMQVQSSCAVSEYSKIVASICQGNSDALEQNEINISGEILADDSKLSERTVSDDLPQVDDSKLSERTVSDDLPQADDSKLSERTVSDDLPQESVKTDQEVGSPEKVATADKSPITVMSNGVVQRGDGDLFVEPTSPKQKPERSRRSGQSKNNTAAERADSDNLEPMDVKSYSMLDLKTNKTRGRQANTSNQVIDTSEYSRNGSDKEAPSVPSRRKGRIKEADTSQFDGPSGKEAESAVPLKPEVKNDLQPPHRSDNGSVCISSPTPSDSVDATRPKRGRPPGSKISAKRGINAVADQPASISGEKGVLGNSQTLDESLPSEDNDFKKEPEAASNSEGKSHRRPGNKVHSEIADGVETPASLTSDSEAKPVGKTGKRGSKKKVTEGESSGKKQKASSIKQPKGKVNLEKDADGELNLMDVPSSPKSDTNTQGKDQSHLEDSVKAQPRRKRTRGTEEISETRDHKTKLDQNIVGSKIKVWWPDDKRFYNGTIDSFIPDTGKHKIVYDDGDIEILLLKDERYKLVGDGSETEEVQAIDVPSPIGSPEVPQNKKAKANSDSASKQAKTQTPMRSGTDSGKNDSNDMKPKDRPKGGSSRKSKEMPATKSKDDTPKTSSKLKEPGSKPKDDTPELGEFGDDTPDTGKDDTPESVGKRKDAPPKSRRKSKYDTPKTSRKLKDGTPKTGSKLMDESTEDTPKTASKSKDDSIGTGKNDTRKIKSNQGTPKVGRKTKPKGDVTPKTGGESMADGTSEKGKDKGQESKTLSKAQESETPTKTQESRSSTGKRKRKGHK